MKNTFDVIVIGVGSMGSAACWYLAGRGYRVLGLEQFDIVHNHGSHTGQSRIIRKAYFEHSDYVPLLERAYENWQTIEKETGATLYHQTGIVYFGPHHHETMKGVRNSAALHHIRVDKLSREETISQFPAFQIPKDFETLYEPIAGFVTPERAIRVYTHEAVKIGAAIHTNEKVVSWRRSGSTIEVETSNGKYQAGKLVITSGSWTSQILPQLKPQLTVRKQMLAWVRPPRPDLFSLGRLPCWFIEDPDFGMLYGFPIVSENPEGPVGLKLARHFPGEIWDPDNFNYPNPQAEKETLRYLLKKYIPAAGDQIVETKPCLYTYSPDSNFIVDHLPGFGKQVAIACGFSGHGFKFASVIGEILADLAMNGTSGLPVEFLSLKRLDLSPSQ